MTETATRDTLTVLVHGGLEALGQPAGPALVAVRLVDGAAALELALRLARVHAAPVDGPLEETGAACKQTTEQTTQSIYRLNVWSRTDDLFGLIVEMSERLTEKRKKNDTRIRKRKKNCW